MRTRLKMPVPLLRVAARLLLVTLSVTALGPLAHDMHEDDCDPAFVLHDEAQHQARAHVPAQDALTPDHCVACHFARASRGPVSWERARFVALDRGVLLYHSDGQLMAAPSAAPTPARAPPVLA
jgi:hypothetical protein